MFVNKITNTIFNSLLIEKMSSNRYNKLCDYTTEKKAKIILPNSPPRLSLEKIEKMTNKSQLIELEKNYDEFLDKYIQLMLLYNNIDEYLETRDLLTRRISQIKRMEKLKQGQMQGQIQGQIQGQYNDDCISGRQSPILPTVQNNTKSHSYYFALKKKKDFLEFELKKVKKELVFIKRHLL